MGTDSGDIKVRRDISSARFVYPFLFDTENDQYNTYVDRVLKAIWVNQYHGSQQGQQVVNTASTLPTSFVWLQEDFDQVGNMLPYIADFVRPDVKRSVHNNAMTIHSKADNGALIQSQPGGNFAQGALSLGIDGTSNIELRRSTDDPAFSPTAQFWKMNLAAVASGSSSGTSSSTEGTAGLRGNIAWEKEQVDPLPKIKVSIDFVLDGIQLALFSHGVGFLTFSAKPDSFQAIDWQEFINNFRYALGSKPFDFTINRLSELAEEKSCAALKYALLSTVFGPSDSQGWRDVYVRGQFIAYVAVYMDGVAPTRDANTSVDVMSKLLYEFRNFLPAESWERLSPTDADMELNHPSLMPYARHMWFSFSLLGGAFIAFLQENGGDVYTKATGLPHQLQSSYFLTFLLALQQRFVLTMLSDKVARRWLPAAKEDQQHIGGEHSKRVDNPHDAFDDIRDAFLAFTARGYFTQVVQTEISHRYYSKWQETFQVRQLYSEISDEIAEMSGYLEMREARKLNSTLQTLTAWSIILATLGVVAAWLAINLGEPSDLAFIGLGQISIWYVIGGVIAVLFVVLEVYLFKRNGMMFVARKKSKLSRKGDR